MLKIFAKASIAELELTNFDSFVSHPGCYISPGLSAGEAADFVALILSDHLSSDHYRVGLLLILFKRF